MFGKQLCVVLISYYINNIFYFIFNELYVIVVVLIFIIYLN